MCDLDAPPVPDPRPALTDDLCVKEELSANLSEEEIAMAISQMRQRRAPVLDEISTEMLKLRGEKCVRWLKVIADRSRVMNIYRDAEIGS